MDVHGQNVVANLIAGKKMKPEKAAEQWVKANPGKVAAWLSRRAGGEGRLRPPFHRRARRATPPRRG